MSENTTDLLNEIGCDTFQRDAMMATIDELIDEIENYSPLKDLLPTDVKFPCTNILLFGQLGSGKSSVYNTMNSIFRGKIFNTALCGGCEHALTKKLRKYPIMPRTRKLSSTLKFQVCNTHGMEHDQQNMLHLRDGINADRVQYTMTSGSSTLPLPLKFRIWDIRGLDQDHLMTEENMRFILEGNIPDHFHFDPSGNISTDMPGFKKHPGLDEKIHCVAIVQDATIVDAIQDLSPEVTKNIKDMQTVMNGLDAKIMNITSNIYGFPWIPADKLSDRNSNRFKEAESFFCGKIDEMFQSEPVAGNPVKERYVRCFICNFKQTNLHFEAPVSFTYSMVFNGSDPVPKSVVDGMIASNTEIYYFGDKVWNLIGDWLVNRMNVTMVSVNISDYVIKKETVKQNHNPDIESVVALNLDLVNFTLTPELSDPSSPEFSKLATSVCKNISELVIYQGNGIRHKTCDVTSIVNNTVEGRVKMSIHLTYGWDQEVIYPYMIALKIVENAMRQIVDNKIVLNIGPVHVLETSFMKATDRAVRDRRDRPDNNPCFPDKTNVILPDNTSSSDYILCYNGNGFKVTCGQKMVFDPKISKCVKTTTKIP